MEKGQKPKSNITTESEEVINESGSDLLHFGGISVLNVMRYHVDNKQCVPPTTWNYAIIITIPN